MSEYATEPVEAPPEADFEEQAGQQEPPAGGEEWPVDDDFGPDPNADLGYQDEQLLPVEIAELVDQQLQEQFAPAIQEMLAAELEPFQEAYTNVMAQDAAYSGLDAVEEFVDNYAAAHNVEVDPEAVLERADELIGRMNSPELQQEMTYVVDQLAASDPQRTEEVVAHLQTEQGVALVQQYGAAGAFSMLFDPQGFAEAMLTTAAQELAPGPRSGNAVHDVLARYYGPSPDQRMAQHEARPQPPSGGPKAVVAKYYGRS
jgi:hypothetical protein